MVEFLAGFVVGVGSCLGLGYYRVTQIRKEAITKANVLKQKLDTELQKQMSIKDRLKEAMRLAEEQDALRKQAQQPSMNALHSKHKNGIIGDIADLEHRKLDILSTILAEGLDPIITIVTPGGGREDVPMSEYVAGAYDLLAKQGFGPPPAPTKDSDVGSPAESMAELNEPKKYGKFFLYKGGKDDGTVH